MRACVSVLLLSLPAVALGGPDWDAVTVKTERVAEGVYMLSARGGNIGLSVGGDGAFLVDDQFAPLTPRILEAVRAVTDRPVRFVLNTHFHPDHTGGNENLGRRGALIVAHDKVRERMDTAAFLERMRGQGWTSLAGGLPVVTFSEAVTFHLNGQTVHAFHVAPAHTDGDSIVLFREANVIHMGDVYFQAGYPFIDLDGGGSVAGLIAAVDRVLALADEKTRIIPGHGALSNRAELKAYRDMIADLYGKVRAQVKAGKSLEEIQALRLTAPYDERWSWGFINGERFVASLYRDLRAE